MIRALAGVRKSRSRAGLGRAAGCHEPAAGLIEQSRHKFQNMYAQLNPLLRFDEFSQSLILPLAFFSTLAADAVTTKFRMKMLQIKQAMRSESTDPATLVKELNPSLRLADSTLTAALTNYESMHMDVETYFSLTVRIIEAKGLPATDLRAEGSDSYVELFVDGRKKARTRTIWKTKNPCWSQDFYVYVAPDASGIEMKVFDESSGLVDAFLGQVVVPMNRLRDGARVEQEWFPLVGESIGHCGPHSKIRLQIEYKKGYSRHIGHLHIKVIEGSKIVGDGAEIKPSAFVEIETIELVPLGSGSSSSSTSSSDPTYSGEKDSKEKEYKEKPFRTTTIRKSNNPKWNEDAQVKVYVLGRKRKSIASHLTVPMFFAACGGTILISNLLLLTLSRARRSFLVRDF